MNVSCPECRSVFRLDPAKITSVSMRARCSVCGGLIPVGAAVSWGDELPTVPPPRTAAPAMAGTPSGGKPVFARQRTPAPTAPAWPPPMPRAEPKPAAPPPPRQAAAPPPAPVPMPNQSASPATRRTPPFAPKLTPAVEREKPAPTRPTPASSAKPSTAAGLSAAFGAPLTPPSRPSVVPPSPAPSVPPPTPATSLSASNSVSAAFSTPSTPAPSPAVVQRKPINPFLANDPNQKARRLARALVSDMVAYHPSKREEGLKGGTLKQLFRDEIKKSYEEYVEQVGREFAESTMHFQEALNDVLAGGRKIF